MKNTIKKIKEYYIFNKEVILYLFFGVCTTAINVICYELLYDILKQKNIDSTIIAWIAAVIFAFITNKLYVFESRKTSLSQSVKEAFSFFGCRALTGVLDVLIMFITVDVLKWNGLVWKTISNIIVIIINYAASKFFIFKNRE